MGPVAGHSIEALGIQALLLYEVDSLLKEDRDGVVDGRPEVVHGWLRLHRICLCSQQFILLLRLLLGLLLLLLEPPLFILLILLLLLSLRWKSPPYY